METAIDLQPIYYSVYKYCDHRHHRRHLGSYSDLRDAIQSIVVAYRRDGGEYELESGTTKPKYWLHPTRYGHTH